MQYGPPAADALSLPKAPDRRFSEHVGRERRKTPMRYARAMQHLIRSLAYERQLRKLVRSTEEANNAVAQIETRIAQIEARLLLVQRFITVSIATQD
jgi:hypothetical protein